MNFLTSLSALFTEKILFYQIKESGMISYYRKHKLRNTGVIMKNHIIFDMDGVIIDSEPEYQKRMKKFMARTGFFISDGLCIKTFGSNRKDTYELFRKYVQGFNMRYEKYYEGRNQVNIDYPLDLKAIVNEDIYPLMEKLKANGFHIGMASSSPRDKILQNLDTLGLTHYFEIIVSGLDFKHSKPDPEIFLKAASLLKVPIAACMVAEDSINGLKAARAAGAISCMIPDLTPYTKELFPFCDYVSPSLLTCKEILLQTPEADKLK